MAGETVPPRATRRGIMAGAAGLLAVRHAWAQGGEPWRILVNFPPGGLLDGTARLIAERSQREGRVPTVVENRPGAGGNIGAAAAARKDTLFYTSAGIGSPGHLAMEYLRQQAGLPKGSLENVPQRGNTEALTALLGGTAQAGFLAIGGGPDLVRTGRLHAIAVSGPHRYPALPEVPTVAESGYPGFDVRIASILMAPRGTPGEAIREWNALARGVLEDPASTPRFANWGVQPEDGTAAGAEAWIRAGRERWGQVVLAAGIEAQ